jgi:hypothetical protein
MKLKLVTMVTVDGCITVDPYSISNYCGNALIDEEGKPMGYLSCGQLYEARIAQAIYLNAWRLEDKQFKRIIDWVNDYREMQGKLTDPMY